MSYIQEKTDTLRILRNTVKNIKNVIFSKASQYNLKSSRKFRRKNKTFYADSVNYNYSHYQSLLAYWEKENLYANPTL